MLTDTRKSPYAKLTSIDMKDMQWTKGFWKEKVDRCRDVMIPNMWELIKDANISHIYRNFEIAAGRAEGEYRNPPFNDGDFYKWLEGASYILGIYPNDELNKQLDKIIDLIAEVQREDGYIFTKQAIESRQNPAKAKALTEVHNFEVYNIGHLITAACIHYRATGKRNLLDIAENAAGYLEKVFGSLQNAEAKTAICPSHYMGVIELYRTTGNKRYLDLAQTLIAIRDKVEYGTDDNQDRLLLKEQHKAVGHAVRANYLYAGVADLYAEVGDEEYLAVLERVWDNVVHQKMYITGGCGALYDGVSPYGSFDYNYVQRIHQAYGREYELPNLTAYNETCAQIGSLFWNWRMLNLSKDAKYADVFELTLYNSALSGISIDGKKFFYENMLRRYKEIPFDLRWSRQREPFISPFCCPPNLVRTIAEIGSYAYAQDADGIYVVVYGSSNVSFLTADGVKVDLAQETNYPWDGSISFRIDTMESPELFSLFLRIPSWSHKSNILINSSEFDDTAVKQPGMFAEIRRIWKQGDVVTLNLDMHVQMIEAHPMVEEDRNQVAFKRGPIVYCLESVDLPKGFDIRNVYIPKSRVFAVEYGVEIDGESVTFLRGKGLYRKQPTWKEGQLYREYADSVYNEFELRLVPYFAWDNRGFGEMTVWLPLA